MLGLVDGDPVQIVGGFGERSLAEAHVAPDARVALTFFLKNICRISAVLTKLQPLVDQLQRSFHFFGCEIPRSLQDSEDAPAIGRHHRPDDLLHIPYIWI